MKGGGNVWGRGLEWGDFPTLGHTKQIFQIRVGELCPCHSSRKSPTTDIPRRINIILKENIKEKVRFCARCFALSDGDLCDLCSDPARDPSLLCVVEQPADMVAVEKSGAFHGMYHCSLQYTLNQRNGLGRSLHHHQIIHHGLAVLVALIYNRQWIFIK